MNRIKKALFWGIVIIVAIASLSSLNNDNTQEPTPSSPAETTQTKQVSKEKVTDERAKEDKQKERTGAPQPEAVSYEIAWSKEISHKAMGDKSLSDFTVEELQKLPVDKRMKYGIVVGKDIGREQVKPTVEKIISDLTQKDPDIDEIHILLYSTKDRTHGFYDVAMASWSTEGDIGEITPKIARENIREGYEISVKVKENLEDYLRRISKEEMKFGFSEAQRRKIYKEIVKCEDQAMIEAERHYDPMCSKCPEFEEDNWDKQYEMETELTTTCKEEVRKRYGITKEEVRQINSEGFEKNWPTPEFPPDPECCDY